MKSQAFSKFAKFSSTLALSAIATCIFQTSFAAGAVVPVWDAQVQNSVNGVQAQVGTVNSTITSTNAGLAELLNSAFFNTDSLFPTYADNSSASLNPLLNIQSKGTTPTQQAVDDQLKTFAYNINKSYRAFSNTPDQSLPQPSTKTDSQNNLVNVLTVKTPSFDTLRLPPSPAEGASFYNDSNQALTDATLANNAKLLNFDSFLNPVNTNSDSSSDSTTSGPQPSYVDYVLQTYEPLLPENDNSSNGPTSAQQNQSLFDKINTTLMNYKANNQDKKAYDFLKNVLANQEFQKFELSLRSIEAKQSLLLSNFNFLKSQTTKQQGLGSAYNLTDKNGNAIKDASPYQVDQYQLNQTVYNPDWYKHMKTASPATLARQQLLLTSMLLRTQYKNEQLNERLLATNTLQLSNTLNMGKEELAVKEMQLKNALFPAAPQQQQQQQNPQTQSNYTKYQQNYKNQQVPNGGNYSKYKNYQR